MENLKKRDLFLVVILSIVTLGIYYLYLVYRWIHEIAVINGKTDSDAFDLKKNYFRMFLLPSIFEFISHFSIGYYETAVLSTKGLIFISICSIVPLIYEFMIPWAIAGNKFIDDQIVASILTGVGGILSVISIINLWKGQDDNIFLSIFGIVLCICHVLVVQNMLNKAIVHFKRMQ